VNEESQVGADTGQTADKAAQIRQGRGQFVGHRLGRTFAVQQQGLQRRGQLANAGGQAAQPLHGALPEFSGSQLRHHPQPQVFPAGLPAEVLEQLLTKAFQQLWGLIEQLLAEDQGRFQALVETPVKDIFAVRQLFGQQGQQPRQGALVRLARMAQLAEQATEGKAANLGGEVMGGDVLQMMGLVENHPIEGWQHGGGRIVVSLPAQGQIRQQQGMVDHQQVGLGGMAPGLVKKQAL
jgi:hypothetical protein